MLTSLSNIQNSLARSLTAAVALGSVVTMAGAIVLGITGAKSSAAYRSALYAALAGTGSGAILGLVDRRRSHSSLKQARFSSSELEDDRPLGKWRNFVVVRKVKESEEITSFYLHDVDNLYVVDGSFFPSNSGVNSILTIIANALRVADHLKERLK